MILVEASETDNLGKRKETGTDNVEGPVRVEYLSQDSNGDLFVPYRALSELMLLPKFWETLDTLMLSTEKLEKLTNPSFETKFNDLLRILLSHK